MEIALWVLFIYSLVTVIISKNPTIIKESFIYGMGVSLVLKTFGLYSNEKALTLILGYIVLEQFIKILAQYINEEYVYLLEDGLRLVLVLLVFL